MYPQTEFLEQNKILITTFPKLSPYECSPAVSDAISLWNSERLESYPRVLLQATRHEIISRVYSPIPVSKTKCRMDPSVKQWKISNGSFLFE